MKQNEISCNVIVDLLPLYNDGICSAESKILVEEHLSTCEDCRQLCEQLTIPTVEKQSEPSEAETFRKVNKKLKRSKFVKIMSVIACICLVIFGIWNVSWYLLVYRPYHKLCKNMQFVGKTYGVAQYSYTDKNYTYDVHMPKYLDFWDGFARITPNIAEIKQKEENGYVIIEKPDSYVIMFIWLEGGEAKYGADIIEGSTGHQMYIDKSLNQIPFENQTDEETEQYKKMITEYHDEIETLLNAAQDMWGDNL